MRTILFPTHADIFKPTDEIEKITAFLQESFLEGEAENAEEEKQINARQVQTLQAQVVIQDAQKLMQVRQALREV